ncbi:MAG TPA: aldehyde dehydrogenase family protein [Gemmatimonadales bacterium]|nr:aldehyde dehydrogenase family protein [Gemmatimonadales bacterium]
MKSSKYPSARNYIGGRSIDVAAKELDVVNPSDGSLLSRVPLSSAAEVDSAVRAAAAAFPAWSDTPIKERVQIFFRYRTLLEQHRDELAALIGEEHGKVGSEAEAEISKAIELTEFACSVVPGENLGPFISLDANERIERCIDEAEAAGATVLLDGRSATEPAPAW